MYMFMHNFIELRAAVQRSGDPTGHDCRHLHRTQRQHWSRDQWAACYVWPRAKQADLTVFSRHYALQYCIIYTIK